MDGLLHPPTHHLSYRCYAPGHSSKGRIRCIRDFKSHDAAARFCRKHGELRNLVRPRHHHNQIVPASLRRLRFARGARIALTIMQAA